VVFADIKIYYAEYVCISFFRTYVMGLLAILKFIIVIAGTLMLHSICKLRSYW